MNNNSSDIRISDRIFQIIYKISYKLLICYWFFRRPSIKGVYVAVWRNGKVLIIKNSYKRYYTLPSGKVKNTENIVDAGIRELREEVSIHAEPEDMRFIGEFYINYEYKKDFINIYEMEITPSTSFYVDNREVIWGEFLTPEKALSIDLFPPIRDYLEKKS